MSLGNTSPAHAILFDVGGEFDDGTAFSGIFDLNIQSALLENYNITTSRSTYDKSSEYFANGSSRINLFPDRFEIAIRGPAFPVGPRYLDELFLVFAGSPIGFDGGQLLTSGTRTRESRYFEPGAVCDPSSGTRPGGCGPFIRYVTTGQAVVIPEAVTVPEPKVSLLTLSSVFLIGGLFVKKVARRRNNLSYPSAE
jgi:hypothetical protein